MSSTRSRSVTRKARVRSIATLVRMDGTICMDVCMDGPPVRCKSLRPFLNPSMHDPDELDSDLSFLQQENRDDKTKIIKPPFSQVTRQSLVFSGRTNGTAVGVSKELEH